MFSLCLHGASFVYLRHLCLHWFSVCVACVFFARLLCLHPFCVLPVGGAFVLLAIKIHVGTMH